MSVKFAFPVDEYAFLGNVVRLTHSDFARWERAYRHIDILGHLQSRDDYLSDLQPEDHRRKKWFVATSNWLMRLNQEAKERVTRMAFDPDSF